MDSYRTRHEAAADRDALERLRRHLDLCHRYKDDFRPYNRVLQKDECGLWRLHGRRGSITTFGPLGSGYLLSVYQRPSPQNWKTCKRKLAFCGVTLDAEDEGCLLLREMPSPQQATVIRKLLGFRRVYHYGNRPNWHLAVTVT